MTASQNKLIYTPIQQGYSAFVCGLLCLLFLSGSVQADALVPPEDPRQSITYWQAHTLSADSHPDISLTHDIFSILLRAWDHSRLRPGLFVVKSGSGPWAASLADGNVLISRSAIELCMQYGTQRGEHLLAFVLAHELAHQRADDLWHQRFFRLLGHDQRTQDIQQQLRLKPDELEQIQQKEAQADHDGLLLMASVGFDPHQVIDKSDFFSDWVEHIWGSACDSKADRTMHTACQQARGRALQSRLQLETLSAQSSLYELGTQSLVAGDYQRARHYFTVFGRDYPSRAVISALAISYLAEAQQLLNQLIQQGQIHTAGFYYPLLLDSTPFSFSENTTSHRGQQDDKKQLIQLTDAAIEHLEQAIRLAPDHRHTYLLLAVAHLMAQNTYMARGILQGRYIPRFKPDHATDLLLAMTLSLEKNGEQATRAFDQLLQTLARSPAASPLPSSLLYYTAFYNSAAHSGDTSAWKQLAKLAHTQGNGLLFQLTLQHIRPTTFTLKLTDTTRLNNYRPGDRFSPLKAANSQDFWIQGEKHVLYRLPEGSHFVVNQHTVTHAWQAHQGQIGTEPALLKIGDAADRPIKALGLPERTHHLLNGEYLAYDRYGLAIKIHRNHVHSWFLY